MDEDEAALLAELRAISQKSAASRFDDDEHDKDLKGVATEETVQDGPSFPSSPTASAPEANGTIATAAAVDSASVSDATTKPSSPSRRATATPPWKRKPKVTQQQQQPDIDQQQQQADTDQPRQEPVEDTTTTVEESPTASTTSSSKKLALPWKRNPPKRDTQQQPPPFDPLLLASAEDRTERETTTTTTAAAAAVGATESPPYGIPPSNVVVPSTFPGERGGAAQDAELLALLRGVSAQTGASSRFDDDNHPPTENDVGGGSNTQPKLALPWKQKRKQQQQQQQQQQEEEPESIVAAAPPLPNYGIPSDLPSTFSGERGGTAQDAELLALLRGVSSQTGASSRFDDDNNNNNNNNDSYHITGGVPGLSSATAETVPEVAEPSDLSNDEKPIPPWRRNNKRVARKPLETNEVVVVAVPPSQPSRTVPLELEPAHPPKYGITSDLPSTFQGERGGPAEDAELLALLRGVSLQSAASRFDEGKDDTLPEDVKRSPASPGRSVATKISSNDGRSTPPWKRGIAITQASNEKPEIEVVMEVPPALATISSAEKSTKDANDQSLPTEQPRFGIKSDLPSTFQGERGGSAEDAELLALLRGVSSQAGASRFDDEADSGSAPTGIGKPNSAASPKSPRSGAAWRPWKRGAKNLAGQQVDGEVTVAEPAKTGPVPQYGIKSDLPSTFQGERGGPAEDAELLALLRGVNSRSTASRFSDDPLEPSAANVQETSSLSLPKVETGFIATVPAAPPKPVGLSQQTSLHEECLVTRDTVSSSLLDKNWKIRSQAYEVLSFIIKEMVESSEGLLESDNVLEGLDECIPSFMEDSNAGALDKALEFALLYAEHCRGAGDAERAGKIVLSLLKKNAFNSRPTTIKMASDLTLKLMEVGSRGFSSVHSVVDVLLEECLKSRKPKVIQASATLILEAALHFGAATLPLASITDAAPKLLAHSNAKVRDNAVKILAEICRVLGSKAPLQGVVDNMKKAQLTELDALLSSQPEPTPVVTGLRNQKQGNGAASSEDALAAMEAGAREREAQRFASRPAVDLVAALAKSDYAKQIELPKWSQKVAALNAVLECGGEKPYKLTQPSPSVNYKPLILDMRKLLLHTHFAVCCKAMEVLSMLAEGVGEKLYPLLRPTLTTLLQISKDKKLTKPVHICLDSLFGNVLGFEHLLESDDALPSSLDERQQKNALARSAALEFLGRCVERNDSAGPRGSLSVPSASGIVELCTLKLGDSDASVRKAATTVFQRMQELNDENIVEVVRKAVDALRTSNLRAYKIITNTEQAVNKEPTLTREIATEKANAPSRVHTATPAEKPPALVAESARISKPEKRNAVSSNMSIPHLDEALAHVSTLRIPQWDAPSEDGGILEGLKASKWLLRQDAIKSLTSFVESGHLVDSKDVDKDTSAILLVVREQTRGFNETNVNIMKAIIQLFIAVCGFVESKERVLVQWAAREGAAFCVQKISDRKLSDLCKSLLTSLCVVALPSSILLEAFVNIKGVKSPVAHEEFLKWLQTFCDDFGAAAMGPEIGEIVPHLIGELGASSAKIQKEAAACFAILHQQIGPQLKALSLSLVKDQRLKTQLQKCIDDNPYNPSYLSKRWPKESLAFQENVGDERSQPPHVRLAIDVPKTNIFSVLPNDVVARLGSKDGKAAWKMRKAALEEIEVAVKGCSGLINADDSVMKDLIELTRGLRDRLTDTQINLRPIAARTVGSMLAAVDRSCQAKLGKIVFAPLINLAMNDIKKPLRDASLDAIRAGVTATELDGGGLNELALENLVIALVSEVNEASIRACGLPEVLLLLQSFVEHLPNLDTAVAARGQPLGEKYAAVIIECLTSSKTETRSAALLLLETSFRNEVFGLESIAKAQGRLKPAKQRSVAPLIAKLTKGCTEPAQSAPTFPTAVKPLNARETFAAESRLGEPATSIRRGVTASVSPRSHGSRHPLVSRSGKRITESTKSILWPVFPEEPHGSILGNLKRFWAPHLPAASASALFPSTGIRKQDDAKTGCELLSRALEFDRTDNTFIVEEQLDLILKWIMFALCSKETTTGLQDILSLIKNTFQYMVEIKREFTDSEAIESVPFILEKASTAKGRFHDMYAEIISLAEMEVLLPPKRLGAVVCAAIMDGSTHAKSRASACETCIGCVEKAGLAGVGKKGVLSAAKLLSQEAAKYRASALDLMEAILSKMNNDMQRLVRICGPNLSDRGRQLLEERLAHGRTTRGSSPSPSWALADHRSPSGSPVKSQRMSGEKSSGAREPQIFDELPKLSLRSSAKVTQLSDTRDRGAVASSSDDPFAFSLRAFREPLPVSILHENSGVDKGFESATAAEAAPSSAAALLRARLLKIRGNNPMPGQNDQGVEGLEDSVAGGANGSATLLTSRLLSEPEARVRMPDASLTNLDTHLDSIRTLLDKAFPVTDRDEDLTTCIKSLKVFHAALSQQQHSSTSMSPEELAAVRSSLLQNIDHVVDFLRRLIAFALQAGEKTVNGGILLPLLSLCLAALMALFRDVEFGPSVSTEELTLLLRETGVALLDPRLSSHQLSEETGSQMVRAINKLAVQAATGASRYASFQALMTLQLQLQLNLKASVPEASADGDEVFTHRLSRVVTKLFARIIRAEEGRSNPYSQSEMDMEALLCAVEDYLSLCRGTAEEEPAPSVESVGICTDMAKSLILSILDAHGSSAELRRLMEDVEIHDDSALGEMVAACEDERGLPHPKMEVVIESTVSPSSTPPSRQPKTPSRDVAVLVSKLGSAPSGVEREDALHAIRLYRAANGDEEIRAHLQQLSGPFREYIEEQLGKDDDPGNPTSSSSGPPSMGTTSVSERIRNLRSRLQVTDTAVQRAIEDKPTSPESSSSASAGLPSKSLSSSKVATLKQSRLAAPTPSRLSSAPSKLPTPPSHSRLPAATSSSQALRERLAARGEGSDTTSSRAAALRARLEAVKIQSQQQQR